MKEFLSLYYNLCDFIYKIFCFPFEYVFNLNFFPYETIHQIYGFSEPSNERMFSVIEMFHNTSIILSFIFFFVFMVLGLTLYYFISYQNPYPIKFQTSMEHMLDALFVLMPLLIIYYLTIPAVSFILHSGDRTTEWYETITTVEIIGHQWYWSYIIHGIEYQEIYSLLDVFGEGYESSKMFQSITFDQLIDVDSYLLARNFDVNKHLVLPVNEYIRCYITSEDVIHSWALPQLGVKVDAIPGRIQNLVLKSIKTGVYFGQCSELCGVNHAFMPIAVEFVTPEIFHDWFIKESCWAEEEENIVDAVKFNHPYKIFLQSLNQISV